MAKTVDRTLDILELFIKDGGGLSLTEISRLAGLNPATGSRYLAALVERGYLTESSRNGTYHLGLKSIDFSYAARRNLHFIEFCYLPLNQLSKETGCDVYMTVLDRDTSLVIEEIGNTAALRINSPIGRRMPLHSTACGKIHLAHMTADRRQALYDGKKLERFTKNTITDPNRLEEELETVQRDGVAYDREEQRLGVWVVGAPIYAGHEKVAAAGIIAPVSRLQTETMKVHAMKIISCTGEISQILSRVS
jgi:IclR family KDG regulon transcriptional repressor